MSIFALGIKFLLSAIAIFFLIFSYLCYNWSAMHEKKERIIIALMVPLIYSFLIFTGGVIILALISLILNYFLFK